MCNWLKGILGLFLSVITYPIEFKKIKDLYNKDLDLFSEANKELRKIGKSSSNQDEINKIVQNIIENKKELKNITKDRYEFFSSSISLLLSVLAFIISIISIFITIA